MGSVVINYCDYDYFSRALGKEMEGRKGRQQGWVAQHHQERRENKRLLGREVVAFEHGGWGRSGSEGSPGPGLSAERTPHTQGPSASPLPLLLAKASHSAPGRQWQVGKGALDILSTGVMDALLPGHRTGRLPGSAWLEFQATHPSIGPRVQSSKTFPGTAAGVTNHKPPTQL